MHRVSGSMTSSDRRCGRPWLTASSPRHTNSRIRSGDACKVRSPPKGFALPIFAITCGRLQSSTAPSPRSFGCSGGSPLPIYFLVYFFSRHVDYITHVGSATGADFAYSNVCLSPAFNRWYWNFGYHVAHHHAPRAHWSGLPQIYRSLQVEPAQRASIETLNIYGLFRPLRLRWMAIAPSSEPKAHR